MPKRRIKEKVSKEFLLSLLEPFHPTLKKGEKIVDLTITEDLFKDEFYINYIIKEGGVQDSKELSKGD